MAWSLGNSECVSPLKQLEAGGLQPPLEPGPPLLAQALGLSRVGGGVQGPQRLCEWLVPMTTVGWPLGQPGTGSPG